jgi:hypothetical protein
MRGGEAMKAIKQLRSLVLDLPIKTVSEANKREHWGTVSKRKKAQRRELNLEWKNAVKGRSVRLPCVVTLTRIAPKLLDEGDNLNSAFKAIRDEIAALLGVDDSPSSPARFEYKQEAIGQRKYRVIISVVSTGQLADAVVEDAIAQDCLHCSYIGARKYKLCADCLAKANPA